MCEVPHIETFPLRKVAKFIGTLNYVFNDCTSQTLDEIIDKCTNKSIYFVREKDIQVIFGNFFIVKDGLEAFEVLCNKLEILKFLREKTGK